MSKLKRGMGKIEFYQHLKVIKEAYNQGFIVYKILYEHIKKEFNLKMAYDTFLKYAKKEFESESVNTTLSTKANPITKKETNKNSSLKEEQNIKDTQKSMEEYLKNFASILDSKKRK